jgi:hypothetical protein
MAKVIGGGKDAAMPESQNPLFTGAGYGYKIFTVNDFPAQSAADDADDPIPKCGNQADFNVIDETQGGSRVKASQMISDRHFSICFGDTMISPQSG